MSVALSDSIEREVEIIYFGMSSRSRILILTFLTEGMVLIAALLLARLFDIALFPLAENPFRDILLGTCSASFPLALFVFSLSGKARTIPLLRSVRRTLITEIKVVFSATKLIDLCFISVLAGFAEELLFRGVIQAKVGVVVASIIFGLVHCVSPAYAVVATIMGFYIGIVYHLGQSLLMPVQLHCVYDFGALVHLRYFAREQWNEGTNPLTGLSNYDEGKEADDNR